MTSRKQYYRLRKFQLARMRELDLLAEYVMVMATWDMPPHDHVTRHYATDCILNAEFPEYAI